MSHEFSIALSEVDRCRLEALVEDGNFSRRARRAEVILLSSDGTCVREITIRTGRSKSFVLRWQERFVLQGFEGLLRNKRRAVQIEPNKADVEQRGKALMLVGSMVEAPPWNRSARTALLSELLRIDDQLAELSRRLNFLEDRSAVRPGSFHCSVDGSLIVAPKLFSDDEENSFAAHVAFGMSKSRMNS
jgi:hypothetical protein